MNRRGFVAANALLIGGGIHVDGLAVFLVLPLADGVLDMDRKIQRVLGPEAHRQPGLRPVETEGVGSAGGGGDDVELHPPQG